MCVCHCGRAIVQVYDKELLLHSGRRWKQIHLLRYLTAHDTDPHCATWQFMWMYWAADSCRRKTWCLGLPTAGGKDLTSLNLCNVMQGLCLQRGWRWKMATSVELHPQWHVGTEQIGVVDFEGMTQWARKSWAWFLVAAVVYMEGSGVCYPGSNSNRFPNEAVSTAWRLPVNKSDCAIFFLFFVFVSVFVLFRSGTCRIRRSWKKRPVLHGCSAIWKSHHSFCLHPCHVPWWTALATLGSLAQIAGIWSLVNCCDSAISVSPVSSVPWPVKVWS